MSYAATGWFGTDAAPQACPPGTTGLPQHCVPVGGSACPPGQMGTPGNCLPVAKAPGPAWLNNLEIFWTASTTNKAIVLGGLGLAIFGIVKLVGGSKPAAATPNRRRFRRNGTDLRSLGLKMHNWHSGMGDPIYAVGSYFVSGRDYPDRDVVVRALDGIERLMRHGVYEGSRGNLRELRSIHAGLRRYLASHGGAAPDIEESERDDDDDDDGWRSDASGRL